MAYCSFFDLSSTVAKALLGKKISGDVRNLSDSRKIAVPKGEKDLKHDRRMFKDHHSALFRNLTFCTKLAFFCIRPPF